MNWLGHVTFVLIAISYLVRDIFLLRLLSIVASAVGIMYYYVVPQEPLWLVINWNLVFLTVNCVQLLRIMYERRRISLTSEQKELYETIFSDFSSWEFLKLMRIATWHQEDAGLILAQQGKPLAHLILIYSGEANVRISGQEVTCLRDGHFIGEMSFLNQEVASADVVLSVSTRYIAWDQARLRDLLQRNPHMRFSLQHIIGKELMRKLKSH